MEYLYFIEVECVANLVGMALTIEKLYPVIAQNDLEYYITDDSGLQNWYSKDYFKLITWN